MRPRPHCPPPLEPPLICAYPEDRSPVMDGRESLTRLHRASRERRENKHYTPECRYSDAIRSSQRPIELRHCIRFNDSSIRTRYDSK